ncbi:MAG: hypothetical protein R3C05_24460 [Pirellulaceae bacterium]
MNKVVGIVLMLAALFSFEQLCNRDRSCSDANRGNYLPLAAKARNSSSS